jgi:hypothetical protein
MSTLRAGDEDLHYSDNSHRWIAPYDMDQEAWDAGLRAHVEAHTRSMGGVEEEPRPRRRHIPTPKRRR